MEKKDSKKAVHIAMLPTPGMGHLIPFIELSRKLSQQHSISITFILPDDGLNMKPQKALLKSLHFINTIFLPPVDFSDLPEDTKLETRIALTVIRSLKHVRESLSQLNESNPVSAYLVDIFSTSSYDVVKDLGIPFYIFFPCAAMLLSFALYLPVLHESTDLEYRDLPEPVKIPGCVPVHGVDFPDSVVGARDSETYQGMMKIAKRYRLADGILVNGFLDLEPGAYKAFEEQEGYGKSKIPPVYPVGPLIRTDDNNKKDSSTKVECLKWLDQQPSGSVLFVSFGSGGTLSKLQLKELAFGLEKSEQRFIWVVKSPNEKASATYFSVDDDNVAPFEDWYTDFVERIKGKGYLLEQWAPQIEILSHDSVGGFVTHCGWNSSLESIVHGVPLIAWPLFAEQRTNAVLLNEDLKVAFRVKENENGVVDSEQIAELARNLIQGEEGTELRNRIRNLKVAAERTLGEDGNSTQSLAKVVQKWINAK